MLISGVLVAVIATAFTVMIRTTPRAEDRLAESKDVTFLQTWIPIDLSTAINSYTGTDDVEIAAMLAANDPSVTVNGSLIGTNVMTLIVPNSLSGAIEVVSYRYIYEDGDARLVRYRISNPGTSEERATPVGVASEIPDPPAGWVPGDPVDFAFDVSTRNQASARPVGEDVTVRFDSGNEFQTGGAGLSAERELEPNDPSTLPDPSAPPTRCGGRMALVLDTSYSVPRFNGGAALESAATGFIDAFTGTPTEVTIQGFDQIAYQLYPNLNGAPGSYFSVLDSSADADGNGRPDVDDAQDRIRALPDVDTPYPDGIRSAGHYIGNGWATIGWTQRRTSEEGVALAYRGGTNWEDALHSPFFDQGGTIRPETPELVVWITDGDPNTQRANEFGGTSTRTDVEAAIAAANAGRSTGARVIGVLVGPADAGLEQNLADVVGNNKWNGTGPDDLGNAVAADYFASEFSQLGSVLRSIMAAQCGGTVTVRKALTDGSVPTTGRWNYSTETGDQVLNTASSKSITFDFTFGTAETEKTVLIREEVVAGYSFVRGDCQVNGNPVAAADIVQAPDGIPGVEVTLQPDEAVSCVMVSQPE